jgi:hypothetical protein
MLHTIELEEPMMRRGRLLAALCGLVALLSVGAAAPAQAYWGHGGFNRPFVDHGFNNRRFFGYGFNRRFFGYGFYRPFYRYGFYRPFYRYGFYRSFYYPRPWLYSRAAYVAPPVYAAPTVIYHHRYHHVVVHHPQCACSCCPT